MGVFICISGIKRSLFLIFLKNIYKIFNIIYLYFLKNIKIKNN